MHASSSFFLLGSGAAERKTTAEVYAYVSKKVPKGTRQNQHPVKTGEVEGRLVPGRTG